MVVVFGCYTRFASSAMTRQYHVERLVAEGKGVQVRLTEISYWPSPNCARKSAINLSG